MVLRLPERERGRLAAPFGDVFESSELKARVPVGPSLAAVGDVTAGNAIRLGLKPRFIVVDFKTKRGPVAPDDAVRGYGLVVERVVCPAGHMTAALYNAVLEASTVRAISRIEVEGEEDLAVMPAIMHLEPGATVIYGLPNRGATLVKVDDESRRLARKFLESFEVISP
jgi:uncharacterized protein (UPF0218 family)